jgi:hypothetical protein
MSDARACGKIGLKRINVQNQKNSEPSMGCVRNAVPVYAV